MTASPATRDDLDTLRRLILSPATGTIETRAALMRCARVVAAWLDAPEIEIVPAPAPAPAPAPRDRPPPILGPGQG